MVLSARAIFKSGFLAGAVFLLLQMILSAIFGPGWLAPFHLIGAIAYGRAALPPPMAVGADVFIVALVIHFALSLLFAFLLSLILLGARVARRNMLLIGAAFGLAVFFVDMYFWSGLFPWFARARNWYTALNHIVFGVILAATYRSTASPRLA